MYSWLLLRRLRGPAFLIMVGVTALLNQWGILRFSRSWPLYLILAGIFGLLERVVLTGPVPPPYPGSYPNPYPGSYPGPYVSGSYGQAPGYSPVPSTSAAPPAGNDPGTDLARRP